MSNFFARVGSSDAYATAINNISSRQAGLTKLQSNMTSGKRVLKPSDDPTAAAQAERAVTRSAQVTIQQRALSLQKDNMAHAETVLGQTSDAIQSFRELVVQAGNGANTPSDLGTITQQLKTLRNQILSYANTTDANGQALFGGLGSSVAPFSEATVSSGVVFTGIPGQQTGTDVTIPNTIDGRAAFASLNSNGNSANPGVGSAGAGTFYVGAASANTGTGTASNVTVSGASGLSASAGHAYQLKFTSATTYDVTDLNDPTAAPVSLTLSGTTASFGGASNNDLSMTVTGTPAAGDVFVAKPKATIFDVMDSAINDISKAANNVARTSAVTTALSSLDYAFVSIQSARGLAGDYLNNADVIDSNQQSRAVRLEGDRSRAEDLDMLQGISDFQNQSIGYQAALKSYAQIQSMNLFDFLK
ncbi:flagellar hook-associated protein FlgL [Curvibacter sp. RS43]|jgi:flagellar hook-associated protein 3 FlgL|uniref:flagellar hook-associated protein FlgL n=1 Tax=Curvibacter microcysteis TaxID=3026419 RepID=UPI00235F2C56|nr:flagellar hook-associated protein FlgL [Curvibacter sp. RS43]MDD0811780.1 flagellar hook-associated protein FlgL [Curvibacter sp. RS43]